MPTGIPLAETVDERQQQPQHDETAGRQNRQRHRPRIQALDRQVAPNGQCAGTADLADRGNERQRQREADAAPKPVRQRIDDAVL